jgi:hypothetical protein
MLHWLPRRHLRDAVVTEADTRTCDLRYYISLATDRCNPTSARCPDLNHGQQRTSCGLSLPAYFRLPCDILLKRL